MIGEEIGLCRSSVEKAVKRLMQKGLAPSTRRVRRRQLAEDIKRLPPLTSTRVKELAQKHSVTLATVYGIARELERAGQSR